MKRYVSGALLAGGIFGVMVGTMLYVAGSFSPNSRSCNGECVRPFLMDLVYYGGEVLFVLGVIDILAIAIWRYRRRRS